MQRHSPRATRRQHTHFIRKATQAAIESLETRQLLSTTYAVSDPIYDPTPTAGAGFGIALATKGNHALVLNNQTGEATLLDTTTGQAIRQFTNPNPSLYGSFGHAAAFVGDDQVAISARVSGQNGKVLLWDDVTTNTAAAPTVLSDGFTTTDFGQDLAGYGNDLIVASRGTVHHLDLDNSGNAATYTGGSPTFGLSIDVVGSRLLVAGPVATATNVGTVQAMGLLEFDLSAGGSAVAVYADPAYRGTPADAFATAGYTAVGADTIVVAAPNRDNGYVYQFKRGATANSSSLEHTYANPNPHDLNVQNGSQFGRSLAVSSDGTTVMIGAAGQQITAELTWIDPDTNEVIVYEGYVNVGAAYAFDTTTFDLIAEVANPNPADGTIDQIDSFGIAVASLPNGKFLLGDINEGSIADDDGAVYVVSPGSVVPVNTAPTVTITAPATAARLQSVTFVGAYTDAEGNAMTASWNFGDGSAVVVADPSNPGASTVTHSFAASGSYNVTLTVSDGTLTTVQTHTITVGTTSIVNGTLNVGGTTGTDAVIVSMSGGTLVVNVNGQNISGLSGINSVVIMGGNGIDVISVGGNVTTSIHIYGGDGADAIKGGAGNDIIVGGAGADLIVGGDGRDLLIGGDGLDRIVGNTDDDILVAGYTSHDNNVVALTKILAEWTSGRDYLSRVNNIRGTGSGLRNNDNYFFKVDGASRTVFDDADIDILTGSQGTDWFVFNADAGVKDHVTDMKYFEQSDDINFIVNG